MIKVVLIEDENVVLKGMAMVLKREPDVDLAGTAEDGNQGLELIYREHPDVVLTDIRMPGLSGLEMIEQAQMRFPDTVFIIFSGFCEFKYVQQAIGLGVLAYLEKPVTVSDLRGALKKAANLVDYKKNYIRMKERTQQVNRVMVEQALYDLMNQPSAMEAANMERLLEVGEYLSFSTELAVLCAGKLSWKESGVDEYRKLIHAMTFSIAGNHSLDIYTLTVEEQLYFVYFNQECQIFPFYQEISGHRQALEDQGISFYGGISSIHQGIYGLKDAFAEARSAQNYACFLEAEEIVRSEDVEYRNHIPAEITDSQYSMEFNFRLQNYSQFRKQAGAYLSYLAKAGIMPELLRNECLDLVYLVQKLSLESGGVGEDRLPVISHSEIMDLESAEEMTDWARRMTDRFLLEVEQDRNTEREHPVSVVKKYIDQHYAESITLETLADQVHMNPTYLSVLFKKEEGVAYSHYLAQVRIRQAAGLLEKGEKAKDVCRKVGYFDYRYFNKQFKKYVGMTPDTYKRTKIGLE